MEIMLFAINASKEFGKTIVSEVKGIRLASHEERNFSDGEHKIRTLESVRGRTVFVLQSLYSDKKQSVNDKLAKLLFFIASLKDAFAEKVVAVIPYFAYARKDRKTKARDPVTLKYMAKLLEACGTDALLTMDIHNLAALQNAFTIPVEHLEGKLLFAPYFAKYYKQKELVVVSPDAGGVKRAEQFQKLLADLIGKTVPSAFLQKERSEGKVTGGQYVVGEVDGRVAIIIDDIISSGTTMKLAVEALQQKGASEIIACATHGLFTGESKENLSSDALQKIIVTNTIPPFRLDKTLHENKLITISAAALFGEAIVNMYQYDSVVDLKEKFPN